jgi:hypothetical protein
MAPSTIWLATIFILPARAAFNVADLNMPRKAMG